MPEYFGIVSHGIFSLEMLPFSDGSKCVKLTSAESHRAASLFFTLPEEQAVLYVWFTQKFLCRNLEKYSGGLPKISPIFISWYDIY